MQKASFLLILVSAALVLAGCDAGTGARITRDKPAPPPVAARSEPVFYNGKTYRLDFSPAGNGVYDMTVSGMTAKQQKDAIAVAVSSLGYFACPNGKRGKLTDNPVYADAKWRMQARCS